LGNTEFKQDVLECGFSADLVEEFARNLSDSQRMSVDAFLEYRSEFVEVGKAAIARALIPYEVPERVIRKGDWYRHLFEAMSSKPDEFEKNQLVIITYNYDRSLEFLLYTALMNSYGINEEEAAQKVSKIPIIHLHGQLAPLLDLDANGRPFSPKTSADYVWQCIPEIKIVHELGADAMKLPQFGQAYHYLRRAEVICFIGFGYLKANLERLGLSDWAPTTEVYGSSYGLTGAERNQIIRFIAQGRRNPHVTRSLNSIEFGKPESEALMFCREVGIFPMA
jgi:hypothetical protein